MIFKRVDFPEPLRPRTPILAPGKKEREISFKISRFGGTILLTRFIVYTDCAIERLESSMLIVSISMREDNKIS